MQTYQVGNFSLFQLLILASIFAKRIAKGSFKGMLYVGVVIALFLGILVDSIVVQYLPENLGIMGSIIGFGIGALVAYYIVLIFANPKNKPAIG